MPELTMFFDMRSAPGIGAPHSELYQTMLDMVAWADGLESLSTTVNLSEHHSAPDGYLPSPIVAAAACVGRTRRARMRLMILMPLYHPIRLAEDLAVLDLLGRGRIELLFIEGYRHEEFEMMEVSISERGRRMSEFTNVLAQAWTGEPFEWRGHRAWVTPKPFQQPRPLIGMGGSASASALRAARMADWYLPTVPKMVDVYREERVRLGKDPGPNPASSTSGSTEMLVAVAKNPEATWDKVAPFCLWYVNSYAEWVRKGSGAVVPRFTETPDLETLREAGLFRVLAPEECVDWIRHSDGKFSISPLIAGLPPAIGWESLRLIEQEVVPAL